jgi:hypothetical protein
MAFFHHDFADGIDNHWRQWVTGRGALELTGESLRLVNADTVSRGYSNAQIDDYQDRPRSRFLWRPPLTLTVRARFSHPGPPLASAGDILRGTAGFGFWNDPVMCSVRRLPTLPRALWFFYASPPSDMKLDLRTPGYGWKAAALDALRPSALPWAAAAPVLVPLMNISACYRAFWPRIQAALHVAEAPVTVPMTDWHTYAIQWGQDRARFSVDGVSLLECPAPRGPLGLVIWLDNQYLVATPWGRLRYGYLMGAGRQWLEVASVTVVAG